MAKQGFATSDRRKVELLPAAKAGGIKVHDCGTVFVLTSTDGATHTLPSIADAGEGWWCRIVEGVDRGGNLVSFTAAAGDTGIKAITEVATNGVTAITAAGTPWVVTFVANVSDAGDQVELVVANGLWVTRGVCAT